MRPIAGLTLATFLTLVPVTLLVPGLAELVIGRHGGTRLEAHLFMSVNMVAGMLAVPIAMKLLARRSDPRLWLLGLLALDAACLLLMGAARSTGELLAWRAMEGAAHLPAVTLLMVAANRVAGRRRGATLGAIATAIMVGVAAGSPLGGFLIVRGSWAVYGAGAALLLLAAVVAARVPPAPPLPAAGSRYSFNRRMARAWMPLALGFMDRFAVGVFVSTFTLYLTERAGLAPEARGILMALFMLPFAALCYPAGRLTDRTGWLAPLVAGNLLFGAVYASYGVLPPDWLPPAMILSGVLSALMYAPNLVLVAELARREAGEGLFGAFQIAGSVGFLSGPIAGGLLLEATRGAGGEPAYAPVFAVVGAGASVLALVALLVLRPLAREWAAAPAGG
jgi:MFS family permease